MEVSRGSGEGLRFKIKTEEIELSLEETKQLQRIIREKLEEISAERRNLQQLSFDLEYESEGKN